MTSSEAFGRAIASRRRAQGISQRKFARIAGISNSHLRKIEGGEISPRLTTVIAMANALGAGADELVRETIMAAGRGGTGIE